MPELDEALLFNDTANLIYIYSHAHSIRNQSWFVKLKKSVCLGTWSEKEKLQYG